MKTETLEVNGTNYPVNIHYENRNNSRVSIGRKAINIRLPLFLPREQRFKEEVRLKYWARKKLEEEPEKFKEKQREYKDGDILKVGDEEYFLRISFKEKQSSSVRMMGKVIQLVISSNLSEEKQNKHISTLLSRLIAAQRMPKLQEKINELNKKHFSKEINKIFFKNLKSRWGSCSSNRNISISTRLLFAPDSVLEYVCLHELAHLIEANHSERFWKLVKGAMPDYKEKIKWLKEEGEECGF